MNQTFSPEQLQQKYDSLPENLRKAIDSSEIGLAVQEIGESNNLMLDQVDELSKEVGYVMLGLVLTSDFAKRLEKVLRVDSAEAQKIAVEVNEKVFDQIRSELMKVGAVSTAEDISSAGGFEIETGLPPQKFVPPATTSTSPATPIQSAPPVVPANLPTETPAPTNMVEKMMTESTVAPQEKIKYTVDPYREPAN